MEQERYEKLHELFSKYLNLSEKYINQVISTNKTFETISLVELELGLELFKSKYDIHTDKLRKYIINSPQMFESYPKLLSTTAFLKSKLGVPKSRLGEAVQQNPRLLSTPIDKIYIFGKSFEESTGIPAADMFSRSFLFERLDWLSPEEMYPTFEAPLTLLAIYGITPIDLKENPSILTNRMGSINNRLKLAKINGVSNADFIRRNSYVKEEIVYAEMMALFELDLIDKYNPYLSKYEFEEITGKSLEWAKKKYPFDIDAQEFIRKDFKLRFKDLHFQTERYFRDLKRKSKANTLTLDECFDIMTQYLNRYITRLPKQDQNENE